ncbi:hypothetical protein [Telmatospirillum sp.]|uniref:hypothetical protein n=1 Tax=Telmatospirillum sp. TaxID=2079197 RepID=UPI002842EEB3|nr:hypothetical protein [Telmatospirillum sp.]MDR3436400.1 hypothetical protein [Telmatospirillum sp.]
MKLINSKTREQINPGDTVTDFRGDIAICQGFVAPRHSGSTGRIHVGYPDREGTAEYYPSVFGAEIVES